MRHIFFKKTKYLVSILLTLLLMVNSFDVVALSYPNEKEIMYLPLYCQARLGKNVSKHKKKLWSNRFGRRAWVNLHHYCQYVNGEQRYYKMTDEAKKKSILKEIILGIQKTLGQVGPDFVLKHDAYYRIADAYTKLGQTSQAIGWLEKAIKIKPKYTKAYSALSRLYSTNGQLEKAIAVLDRGLVKVPKSKLLKRKKAKLIKL